MRLALPGGQWADLRDRLTYSQGHSIRAAFLAIEADRAAVADLDLVLLTAYVEAWNVLGFDGSAVPVDKPTDAPDDVIQSIAVAALAAWKGAQVDPKGLTGTLPTTSQGRRSRSRTRP